MISKAFFCTIADGRQVCSYTITNSFGEYVTLLDYGATIQEVVVRDNEGNLGDVVLGADPSDFESCSYKGGTIGRCANRIAFGRYCIGGKEYHIEQNMHGHFLHGGSGNYAHKLFTGEMFPDENRVAFHWLDKGEAGFIGTVQADFSFSFNDDGRLMLMLEMCSDTPTVLNPTNHVYFNLAGQGDVRDHLLWIASQTRTSRGREGMPDGGSLSVLGTPADFTKERQLRAAMESDRISYFKEGKLLYDEFYLLDEKTSWPAAVLRCPQNGRVLKVSTNMPCLILFCAGGRPPEHGKHNAVYEGYCSVGLETGFVPNAVNCSHYRSPVFLAGEKLLAITVYQFSVQ